MKLSRFALAFVAWCAASGTAFGECFKQGVSFYLRGEVVEAQATMKSGETCLHGFFSSGTTMFDNVSIPERPKNGSLVSVGGLSYRYTPKKGFRGSDSYVFRACGKRAGQPGCSTVRYTTSIQ